MKDSLYSGIEYVMVTALVFTGGALVYEHRRISKLKVSGRGFEEVYRGAA